MKNTKKILVAMSGGVDSSASALILKNQCYDIAGVTMKLFENETICDSSRTCCSLRDVFDAKNVAARLGFSHYVFNFTEDFYSYIIKKFVNDYMDGLTPNPCIDCNKKIKFKKLLDKAIALGYDGIATGHYARIERSNSGRYLLKKAIDESKDQTYFLYSMTQYELSKTIFPLGELLKSEVRKLAERNNLINANKPDSQDICFVKNNNYGYFLEKILGDKNISPGFFVDKNKKIIGQHKGIIYYTIGQRKGLGVSFGKRKFVIQKNKIDNTIVLGDEKDLYQKKLIAGDINLISIKKLSEPMHVTAKIRYTQRETNAIIKPLSDNKTHRNLIEVEFETPQRATTPGQAVVFYDGENVVGGGTILSD